MSHNIFSAKFTEELEALLARSPSEFIHLEKTHFDTLTGPWSRSLVLFGAGGLGRKTLKGLRSLGIEPQAFSDNNPAVHGKEIDGLRVLPPAQAAREFGGKAAFIVTIFMASAPGAFEKTHQQLTGLGCQKVLSFVPLFWKYPAEFLPHYSYDLPHKLFASSDDIRKAFSLLEDDVSRTEYLAQLQWRLNPEYAQIPARATHDIYFPPDLFSLSDEEVFVDCGAYSGDTLQSYFGHSSGRFKKIYSFEPDPINFRKMTELIAAQAPEMAQRVVLRELAVGARSELLHFDAQGAASSSFSNQGQFTVRCETLDSELTGNAATFIKMDIEGAELDALAGAVKTIQQHLPILAISAYHLQDHLWNVLLTIHRLSDSYHFFIRRYTPFILDDMVLYAIPTNRLIR